MAIKKSDALEFVNELEGGWDCILWDPPYLDHKRDNHKDYWKNRNKIKGRSAWNTPEKKFTSIEPEYLDDLLLRIRNKIDNPYVFIEFSNKVKSDLFLIWNKTPHRLRIGNNILNNCEFINIGFEREFKLKQGSEYKHIHKILNIRKNVDGSIKLYKEILSWIKPTHVLDPFAGSYNSAKACKELGIKIDSCDKYLDPPLILRKDINYYLNKY